MKNQLLATTGVAALLLKGACAYANVQVGDVIGAYDADCNVVDCTNGGALAFTSNGAGTTFDTPSLFFQNTGTKSWTGLSITLTGYNGDNNGVTQTFAIPDIAAHTVYQLTWDGGSGGLFQYDYDDEKGGQVPGNTVDAAGNTCGSGSGTLTGLCAYVGDFTVSFSGQISGGGPISSLFSPDPTVGGGNVQGTFVCWEGLDVDGFSETYCDEHALTSPGILANIFTGTNQNGGGGNVPEPATLSLLGAGLGALAFARRKKKAAKA